MITLNKSNFFNIAQQLLEKYYLQPFDGSKKTHLKDGFIERSIHGATHAGRAAFWLLVMHNFLLTLAPDSINEFMIKIARQLNIESEQLLLLLLIVMLCHDAGRKGEGWDIWEQGSAEITYHVLLELGLDERGAALLSLLVKCKDKPLEFTNQLAQSNISPQDYNVFDYLRSLINLGDNLDLMRCVGDFKVFYIFKTLKNIKGVAEVISVEELMKLLEEIHHIIFNQGDMLFSCNLIDLNNEVYACRKAHIIMRKKVNFEQAANVLIALFKDIADYPQIHSYLTGLDVPGAQEFNVEPVYIPFIHGTNSSILSLLPKSNFEIMSPIDMMDSYHAVSMTGELTRGGYKVVGGEFLGSTSFAKISANGVNSYTLKKVIDNYTNLRVALNQHTNLKNFREACETGFKNSYLNINLILIYYVRVRQSCSSLEEVISTEELELLFARIEASRQFYYLIQLLGTHIFPDMAELSAFRLSGPKSLFPKFTKEGQFINFAIYNFLTYDRIIDRILGSKINIKEALEHPTPEHLMNVLNILDVPKKCTLTDEYERVVGHDIELPLTRFFSLQPESFVDAHEHKIAGVFLEMQQNIRGSSNNINSLLVKFVSGLATDKLFLSLGADARRHLTLLDDRVRLFKDLIHAPQAHFKISAIQEYFLERKFPLILLSEAEEKICLFSFQNEEYRSITPLKFGTDIKIIATDNHVHRLEVLKYLEIHRINHIQVILFSDLKLIKVHHKKIASPQHHSNGVPTLKWMAAQKIPVPQGDMIKNTSWLECATQLPGLHSEHNVRGVSALIDDARSYQDIQFEPCCSYRCATKTHHAAIELLVKAGFQQDEFLSLTGYSAKNQLGLAQLILYLTTLNLTQFYKRTIEEPEFRAILALFFEANITDEISETLLNDEKFIKLLQPYQYGLHRSNPKSAIFLYRYDNNLLNKQVINNIRMNSSLAHLVNYLETNNLQKCFAALLANDHVAINLLLALNGGSIPSKYIPLILTDKNIMQAISKGYIVLSDLKQLEAAFILSNLDITITLYIGFDQLKVIRRLDKHQFSNKSYYVKVMESEEVVNALLTRDINTSYQIVAVFKATAFNILAKEVKTIAKYPQLSKMLAVAHNPNAWNLYCQFNELLEQFKEEQAAFQATNPNSYRIATALINDIKDAIDHYFSFENEDPDKINSFSAQCTKYIDVAREVLVLNTGLSGVLNTSLQLISYLNPISYVSSKTTNTNYSFFSNNTAKLMDNMKNKLRHMEKERVSYTV